MFAPFSRRRLLAGFVGAAAALLPVVPSFEIAGTVGTRAQRVDHVPTGELSPILDLGLTATSVGVHWLQHRDARPSLALRTSPDGKTWGEWYGVEGEGGALEDGKLRVFGALVRADGARYAQYRLTGGPVESVTLHALDSATGLARPRLRLVPAHEALAAVKPLGIVSRKQWGADESLRFEKSEDKPGAEIWPEEVTQVEKIVVHHTAGPNVCSSPAVFCQRRSVVAINDIYYYHTIVNGWGDIGYNSLIGYDGRIYEGRHEPEPVGNVDPLSTAVIGAHALHYNNKSHGIALMGDFEAEPVPDMQFDVLERLVGWVVRSQLTGGKTVDPQGASDYQTSTGDLRAKLPNIVGHRDVFETECPGRHLYARLDELREHARRFLAWPPIRVRLRPRVQADATIAFTVIVDNHEPDRVRWMTIKGAVPSNADYVDSYAGGPGQNRGVFDGSVVTWHDPDASLQPDLDRREYVFVLKPKPGVDRAQLETTAWVEFADPRPGVAMSDKARADFPVEVVVDTALGSKATATGDWPHSHNVANYYGDDYQIHEPGDGSASFAWEASLPEAGNYEVAAWWTAANDRATDAPFTVTAKDGDHTVQANQRAKGSQWVPLGTFPFDAGPVRVTLHDTPSGVVIADAVRFRQVRN